MNNIANVSAITAQDVADFIRLDEVDTDNMNFLNSAIVVAKAFIKSWTGQDNLDQFQDFVIVVLVLCQDMYDNRALVVDSDNLNWVVESILGLHQVNLL